MLSDPLAIFSQEMQAGVSHESLERRTVKVTKYGVFIERVIGIWIRGHGL
jgi:hypothetical protein